MEACIIKKIEAFTIRRGLISFNTKKRHYPRKESRGEASPSWSFKEGDVP
jgi:hypothetical protein